MLRFVLLFVGAVGFYLVSADLLTGFRLFVYCVLGCLLMLLVLFVLPLFDCCLVSFVRFCLLFDCFGCDCCLLVCFVVCGAF